MYVLFQCRGSVGAYMGTEDALMRERRILNSAYLSAMAHEWEGILPNQFLTIPVDGREWEGGQVPLVLVRTGRGV